MKQDHGCSQMYFFNLWLRGNVIQENKTKKTIKKFKYILQFYTCSNCKFVVNLKVNVTMITNQS